MTQNNHEIQFLLDAAHRRCLVGGQPMLFHCHHYNTFLQRSIQDANYIESAPFLIGAAAEQSRAQLICYFIEEQIIDIDARKAAAMSLYQWAGFGLIDLSALTEAGGVISSKSTHYASAWMAKFGKNNEPVCHFSVGWIVGACEAIYDLTAGTLGGVETSCCACGADEDVFEIKANGGSVAVFDAVGLGEVSDHAPLTPPANNVNYEGIFGALTGMEIVGNEQGLIPAFGVVLTRMYANYYNRISFEFLHALKAFDGGREIAEDLLIEAGHVCAFNTFGGIMTSPEWDALIKPSLQSDEDWVHGMVAAVNALGWGRWEIESLSREEVIMQIQDDYESSGYLAMYGKADYSISYLAQGAAAGIMDLVYVGDVKNKPEFTEAYYSQIFKSDKAYVTSVISSKAMGDATTRIKVSAP